MKVYFENPESWAWMQVAAMLTSAAIVYLLAKYVMKGTHHE